MKKILIGVAILGVGAATVFGARKGLQEHAVAGPAAETELATRVEALPGAQQVGMATQGDAGSDPRTGEGSVQPERGAAAPASQRTPGPDTTPPRSATGIQRTDRGPMYPAQSPTPLSAQESEPAQDPEIATVLRRAAKVYAGAESLQADFSQRSTNPILRTTVASKGTLYQRRPDRFLMRFSDPAGDLIVSDGSYFWVYYPSVDRQQVLRMPAGRGAGVVDLQAQFVGDPLERFVVTSEGREEIAGRSAHVLLLEPREALGYRALKVWIDAADYLVRQFEVTEENGMVRHFELSNLKLNPRLGDDLFHFTVPEGARVVDRG
jgi:outer membrane lipoprotein-sorting protein